jgi:hypothetical protein
MAARRLAPFNQPGAIPVGVKCAGSNGGAGRILVWDEQSLTGKAWTGHFFAYIRKR